MPKKLQVKLEEVSESDSSDDGIVFEAPPAKVNKKVKKFNIKEEPIIHEEKENITPPNEEESKDLIWCAKCKKKTESDEVVEVDVKGKSEGKIRRSIKCKCSICGTCKTTFKSKPK